MRKGIDKIDRAIIKLLARRNNVVLGIAEYKRKYKTKVVDMKRQKKVFDSRISMARKCGLDTTTIEKIFRIIINNSCKVQRRIIKNGSINKNK
jgi:4-amino-4-deoxychorismate mutase